MAQVAQRPLRAPRRKAPAGQRGDLRPGSQEVRNHEATIAYIKRTLCSKPRYLDSTGDHPAKVESEPLEDLLPPLTSSNAVDVQLYALIAVILSNFVQVWYNRITPDQDFVSEIVQIIAHCTRGLEQRVRHVDLESLLLDELPQLIVEHVNTVRISRRSPTKALPQFEQRRRFLTLRPHLALEPVPSDPISALAQQENETAWCMLLVNRILPLVLPPEDMLNPCLDVLVSEIFTEMIFHNGICGKACEPWLIWDGLAKLLRSMRSGYGQLPDDPPSDLLKRDESGALFPARDSFEDVDDDRQAFRSTERRPIVDMNIWSCGSQISSFEQRMPWLSGLLSLMQWILLHGPGRLCCTNSRLDRLLSHHFSTRLYSASTWLPHLLQATRTALFPNNALAPARIPPSSPEEVARIRSDCAAAIVDAIPPGIWQRLLATKEVDRARKEVEGEDLLGLLEDGFVNRHLVVSVVDLLVVRLFPELIEEE
ncbi:uncharacterized protein MYCGRDRAFT_66382 [Zymoseptoria tritici IPO323]|uniref:PXA domain-containing protein n=1 Tax=Zymoseptoria tritici (strain CBS 115943 / IPO323) TaxID=336722 RepID=F9WY35_ZYMTI|nr:uncharacterized protein MYCGRDRAFT_66382 [Zymoseptoria tritici IPO323]EGP92260.1 hypothetical protein MYCGRDRAFT_66382 [Zymoseptoria tritici IPO323]